MDQAVLVGFDIEKGQHVIDLLDLAGSPPEVALWAKLPEYELWRFVLASSFIHGYHEMVKQFHKAGITPDTRPTVLLFEIDDPFIVALRSFFDSMQVLRSDYTTAKDFPTAKTENVRGVRIGGQYFGPQVVEDGYLYRVS